MAVFPPRKGFFAATEEFGKLVLRDSETFSKSANVRTDKQAHVASLGLVDEDGRRRSYHFIAVGIRDDFNLDGGHFDRRPVLGGGDVDVEGDLFGFHFRFF